MSNIIEKAIMPYNTSNKIIHNNKYHLFAPAASTGRIGMAGFNTSQFTINNQIVSLNDTVVRVIDINDIPDDITYDGVDGIKTAGVMYKNYTREVIDVIVNDVPSYITVTGTLLVTLSKFGINEMFMAEGRIWTRELKIAEGVVTSVSYFMSLEAIITSQLGEHEIASKAEAEAGDVNNKYMTPLRTKEAIDAKASYYYDKVETDNLISTINKPAKVFADLTALLADLDLETEYEIGTSFYLREMTQFDFWYTGVAEDDTKVAWYGYKISPLEAKTDLTDYVEKETGKELIPTADLQKLQATDSFNKNGTYMDLKVGLAYNLEGAAPYVLDEAFDLRVTASEDVEVTDGLAKVKELQAVVTADANGVVTNITSKPNILVTTNDNWLKIVEGYSYTNKGITIEWVDENTLKFSGTATETGGFAINPFVYSGLTENTLYDVEAKLYANVLSGDIESGNFIEFASSKLVGIDEYATLNLASQTDFALNGLSLGINITDTVAINDLVVRFYTKHSSNPNQLWVRPNPLEYSLYTSEIVEANDWFKDNVINYETKQFTKYWHKYIINGSEASWSFYGAGSGVGTYVHILELATELTDLLLTNVAGAPYGGNLKFIGRASTYGISNMVSGDIGILYGTDLVNRIVFATADDLETFKNVFSGSYPLPVWIKHTTPTITQLTTIDNEILYPAYNYGLEFGLLDNKLKVEYSSDFQKQITTNLENIVELKATKAETYETSVTIGTADWVADGVTATYKAIKTVNGVLSSDNPILAFDLDGIADTAWNDYRTEFAKIGLASTTDDNEITFYASAIPTEDIAVIVKVVR